jgi:hypothetical protein
VPRHEADQHSQRSRRTHDGLAGLAGSPTVEHPCLDDGQWFTRLDLFGLGIEPEDSRRAVAEGSRKAPAFGGC